MERHVYTIPVDEFEEYKRRLKLSSNMLMSFWYETPKSKSKKEEKQDWKAEWKTVSGIWKDYDNVQEEFQNIRSSFNNRIPE